MKRMGIEGIYLGGWATSAKGSVDRGSRARPGELSAEPGAGRGRAASCARCSPPTATSASLRSRMTEAQRAATPRGRLPAVHHRRRRHRPRRRRRTCATWSAASSRSACPATTSRTRSPGAKKCGHQGGKVLVAEDEQIKRLNAARFQLDVMRVPGHHRGPHRRRGGDLLDGRGDERDQPFILGATNLELPTYKVGFLAILQALLRRWASTSSTATCSTQISRRRVRAPPTPGSSARG